VQTPGPNQPTIIERIERALVVLAYFIELDGDVHVPMFERFEAELEELRQKESARDRARRLLASYSREGGVTWRRVAACQAAVERRRKRLHPQPDESPATAARAFAVARRRPDPGQRKPCCR
jgi:hypothetical protein